MMRKTSGLLTLVVSVLLSVVGAACAPDADPPPPPPAESAAVPPATDEVQVFLRELAATAPLEVAQGKALFEQNCSVCHGPAADGTAQGPPLIHIIYEPSHHGDAAFVLAARNGVRAHHWRFGDMPPLPAVTEEMVLEIVGYIRWMQRQVGIE